MTAFHEGERAVQARAGVMREAAQVGKTIRSDVPPVAAGFLANQRLAVIGVALAGGGVWAGPLTGEPGFITASDGLVRLESEPLRGDPLAEWRAGPLGMISIEFDTRRRIRVNGEGTRCEGVWTIRPEQVYGNCPRYIQARRLSGIAPAPGAQERFRISRSLAPFGHALVRRADTFFIATVDPEFGADVSHRGGSPGFVRILDERTLVWPDYPGNRMFQTLGNLHRDPRAGLLFPDFRGGTALQLTGTAEVLWDLAAFREMPGAERAVRFRVEEARLLAGHGLVSGPVEPSRFNPDLPR